MGKREFTIVKGDIKIKLNFDRLNKNFEKAQYRLDSQVMLDMIPLMPFNTGTFRNKTAGMSATLAGSGIVIAATPPQGRFLYYGKVMVDPETGSAWARPGARKVVTEKPLNYSNPQAVPKWFEEAKRRHVKEWVDIVKETMGEGE